MAMDINFSNKYTAQYSNKKCSKGPLLKRGDKVYLLRKYIKIKWPSSKLNFKKIELFEILKEVKAVNYKLQLPEGFRLYSIFYVSLLKLAREDALVATNTLLYLENEIVNFEVKNI